MRCRRARSVAMRRAFGISSSGRTSTASPPTGSGAVARHGAEPAEAAAAAHADQHGLGLIVERVCGDDGAGLRTRGGLASSR